MIKFSVVLAVFNEEENLATCLESVKNLADEIVIVDGGSTDKTVEIAKKYKAKVIITDNPPMFHINKQKAIDAATGDWILQLDADEHVSPELSEEIAKIIENSGDVNGYWIPRINFFLGRFLKKGGQYPDYTLRLYRRGKSQLPCKSVHEQAVVEGKVEYLKHDLLHYADKNFKRYLLRFNRYTNLEAQDYVEKKIGKGFLTTFNYLFVKPLWWFLWTFFRHKGFQDGFPGFVFALFSGLRFSIAYMKYQTNHAYRN